MPLSYSYDKEPTKEPTKESYPRVPTLVKFSFTITYILLLTTATITFIEAMRTKNPTVRHVLNLETCISIVAGYFYSVFIAKIDEYEKTDSPINWPEMVEMRYIDWSITTPLMLIALCVVLSSEIGLELHLPIIAIIIALNYVMLYAGYLGETQVLTRITANILGFVPFLTMFGVIYWKYVMPKYNLANRALFYFYLVIWSLYGLVYFFDEETKNIAMNVLDLFAKCLIGLGLWVYYVHIIRL
jgi:bacteriorhodopsin